jgi:hypothetical protein
MIPSASYGHDHPQAAHEHAIDAAGHGHPSAPGESFDPHAGGTCALCAACCVGGAILNSLPLPSPLLERGDPAFPPVSERFLGFLPDRLDRPPQRILV